MSSQESKTETEAIRRSIDRRLKARVPAESLLVPLDAHLDEDAICVFVQGRLEEAESSPVISHLIACSFCRRTTAQLIRLESQFAALNDEAVAEGPDTRQRRVRLFLESLAARVAPSFEEDAVFAYQNPEPEPGENSEPATEEMPKKLEDEN